MKRLAIGLGVFALVALANGCGGCSDGPSMVVKSNLTFEFQDREIRVFTLAPVGKPSGVLTFKSVHNGQVMTLGSCRVDGLSGPMSVAVESTPQTLDVAWNVPDDQFVLQKGLPALAAGSVVGATVWMNDRTVSHGRPANDVGICVQDRYVDEQPSARALQNIEDFEAVVQESTKVPAKTSYCLTITIDGQ